ncbi:MAG: DedA family protein [Desulfuromonadales bacterium]|nr:DedA family protein [Desulfuromonadales bacterium]
MTMEAFITAYGYPALGVGTLLEGGMVGMIAGGLAHRGYMQLQWVICVIFACAFCADQFFFQVGKRNGKNLLKKKPAWEAKVERVRRFLVAYQIIAILGFRFIYGMRSITPIVIGASGIDTRRFVLLNLCSTFLWASAVGCSGYFFSHLLETLLADVKHNIIPILMVATLIGCGLWVWRRWAKGRVGGRDVT